jgi:hypothetical protein
LSVHRNKLEAQRRRELIRHFKQECQSIAKMDSFAGFVIVAFDRGGNFISSYDTGRLFPKMYLPDMIRTHMLLTIQEEIQNGIVDDYEPRPRGVPWN